MLAGTQAKPLLGQYKPSCDGGGHFEKLQCHEAFCFCVDPKTGIPDMSTRVQVPGKPDCKFLHLFIFSPIKNCILTLQVKNDNLVLNKSGNFRTSRRTANTNGMDFGELQIWVGTHRGSYPSPLFCSSLLETLIPAVCVSYQKNTLSLYTFIYFLYGSFQILS